MMRKWAIGGAVAILLGVIVQWGYTFEAGRRMCATLAGASCHSSPSVTSVVVDWSLPSALAAFDQRPLQLVAHTSLIRRRCTGTWTAGLGARIEVADAARVMSAASLSTWHACLDSDGTRASGEVNDAVLSYGGCSVRLETVRLGSATIGAAEALQATIAAAVDPASAPKCAALLPPSAGPLAALLPHARLSLISRHEREPARATALAPTSSVLRRYLSSRQTSHELEVVTPVGRATLQLSSTPAQGPSSPELQLSLRTDGMLAEQLPEDLRRFDVRWRLDHESGQVDVNGQTVVRVPMAATRPAGRVVLPTDECAASPAGARRALFFVETGDGGELLRPEQLKRALSAVDAAVAGGGALVSVFVHGWHHSATPGDSYVCRFGDVVAAAEEMETYAARLTGRPPREVLGIYVGWPGALYQNDLANTVTTFWDRLNAADRLGMGATSLRPLLDGLAQRLAGTTAERRADRRSVLIVAGHSMGGRAVFHALRDGLLAAAQAGRGVPHPDLVLFLNPAFSASVYRALHDQQQTCAAADVPVLLFSSEADGVTRRLYPAGQTVAYQDSAVPFLEYIYTAPNFEEFVTHRLRLELESGSPPGPDGPQTIQRGFERVPANSQELYRDNPITVYRQPRTGRPAVGDIWYRLRLHAIEGRSQCGEAGNASSVVEVDAQIVPDHNGIFTPPFMEYIVRVLNRHARGSDTRP